MTTEVPTTEENTTQPEPEPMYVEPPPVVPPVIRFEELLSSQDALRQKETADGTAFNSLSSPNIHTLRDTLYKWVHAGFPESYRVLSIPFVCPSVCSDGARRSPEEYIVFVSGKTIQEHLALFQTFLDGIRTDYVYLNNQLSFVVSRTR